MAGQPAESRRTRETDGWAERRNRCAGGHRAEQPGRATGSFGKVNWYYFPLTFDTLLSRDAINHEKVWNILEHLENSLLLELFTVFYWSYIQFQEEKKILSICYHPQCFINSLSTSLTLLNVFFFMHSKSQISGKFSKRKKIMNKINISQQVQV